jgi:hypothetical protein
MPPASALPRTGWDPERHARRLVPLGGLLAAGGLYAGGLIGFAAAAVGLVLLLASAYSARDGLLLLGPFARYELARTARIGKRQRWRVIYTLAFALLLFLNLFAFAPDAFGSRQVTAGRFQHRLEAANTAFFIWYAVCLIGYVAVLAVTQFTSLVAEERAGKRWEILLTTDLRPREILFGKAAGRVPQLLDPILASVPVLTIATLFGGVSPTLVLLIAVAALALAVGIAGVAAFYSVFCPTVATAVTNTVGLGVLYAVFSGFAVGLATVPLGFSAANQALAAFAAGNPIAVVASEKRTGPVGEPLEATLARSTRKFAAFHLGVGLLFGFVAGRRLRSAEPWGPKKGVTLRREMGQRPVPPDRAGESALRKRHVSGTAKRPPVSDYPIAWWELYGQYTPAQTETVKWLLRPRTGLRVVLGFSLVLAAFRLVLLVADFIPINPIAREILPLDHVVSGVLLFAVFFLTLAMILGPLVRATRTVARERNGDTLEALRTLPLDPREIIYQKWLGCVQSAIPFGVVILGLLVPAVLTGFASVLSLLGWAVCVTVYVMVAAAYGLVFSVRAKTPARATFAMIIGSTVLFYTAVFVLSSVASLYSGEAPARQGDRLAKGSFLVAQFPPTAVGAILVWPMIDEKKWEAALHFIVGLGVSLSLFALLGSGSYRFAVHLFSEDDAKARAGK